MYKCMYVCMCVYVCVYVCMCVCMYVCTYVRTYVCLCMYVLTYVRMCVYVCMCVYLCMYVCVCVCVCVCMDGCSFLPYFQTKIVDLIFTDIPSCPDPSNALIQNRSQRNFCLRAGSVPHISACLYLFCTIVLRSQVSLRTCFFFSAPNCNTALCIPHVLMASARVFL